MKLLVLFQAAAYQSDPQVAALVVVNNEPGLFSPGIAAHDDIRLVVVLISQYAGTFIRRAAIDRNKDAVLWVSSPLELAIQINYRLDAFYGTGAEQPWIRQTVVRFLPEIAPSKGRSNDLLSNIAISRALLQSELPLTAADVLEAVAQDNETKPSLTTAFYNALGWGRMMNGDFFGAGAAYVKALELDRKNDEGRSGIIHTTFLRGDIIGAVQLAEKWKLGRLSVPVHQTETNPFWLIQREVMYLMERYGGGKLTYDCKAKLSFCCRSGGVFPRDVTSPDLFYTHIMVAVWLDELGGFNQSLSHLKAASRLCPSSALEFRLATATPVVFESEDAMKGHLAFVEEKMEVAGMDEHTVPLEESPQTYFTITPSTMFIGYQGVGEHHLLAKIAQRIDQGFIFPGISSTPQVAGHSGDKVMAIGVASAFLRDHSVGRLIEGVLTRLSKEEFAIEIYHVTSAMWGPPSDSDAISSRLAAGADRVYTLPRNISEAAAVISGRDLDFLLLPEVGMDTATYALAFHRLAPVQATFWGHPVSQGIPSIDYIITSDLFEPLEGGLDFDRYTEQHILLDGLTTYFPRPPLPPLSSTGGPPGATYSLPPDANIYLIGQTLQKFHVNFDESLEAIASQDPLACFVITYSVTQKLWRVHLEARMRRRFGKERADQSVVFVPSLPRAEFYRLLQQAAVVLDPYPFGGGVTALEGG